MKTILKKHPKVMFCVEGAICRAFTTFASEWYKGKTTLHDFQKKKLDFFYEEHKKNTSVCIKMICTYKYPENFVHALRNMVVILPLWSLAIISCRSDREKFIRAQADDRVSEYAHKERAKCRVERMNRAAYMADSILLDEAAREAFDLHDATEPWRPISPPPIELLDSGPVAPIFTPNNRE